MDKREVQECLNLLRIFADEKRLNILNVIGSGKLSGVDILKQLPMPQPTLSYHLKILCENDILDYEIKWKWTYYTINNKGLERVLTLLKKLEVSK